MFLKIVRETKEKNVQNIYECNDIQITRRKTEMIFSLNRNGQYNENIAIVIDGEQPRSIYIMNNDGKTIESLAWNVNIKQKQ